MNQSGDKADIAAGAVGAEMGSMVKGGSEQIELVEITTN